MEERGSRGKEKWERKRKREKEGGEIKKEEKEGRKMEGEGVGCRGIKEKDGKSRGRWRVTQ